MAGEDWRRLADYVVARRVELGMRDRRAFAEATGVTERTLGKLENGQHVSPSTLGMVENRLGWAPGSCRRILAGGEPKAGSQDLAQAEYEDPTLWHIASTPGLPPDVVRGLVALARNWRQGDGGTDEQAQPNSLPLTRGEPADQVVDAGRGGQARAAGDGPPPLRFPVGDRLGQGEHLREVFSRDDDEAAGVAMIATGPPQSAICVVANSRSAVTSDPSGRSAT